MCPARVWQGDRGVSGLPGGSSTPFFPRDKTPLAEINAETDDRGSTAGRHRTLQPVRATARLRHSPDALSPVAREHGENRLLHMQAVLRLVENYTARIVEHLLGHLLARVGRQAVHEERIRFGGGK